MRNWLKKGQTTALPDPEKEKYLENQAEFTFIRIGKNSTSANSEN